MKKILIAVDDSPVAEKVVSAGYAFCKDLNAEVAIVSMGSGHCYSWNSWKNRAFSFACWQA